MFLPAPTYPDMSGRRLARSGPKSHLAARRSGGLPAERGEALPEQVHEVDLAVGGDPVRDGEAHAVERGGDLDGKADRRRLWGTVPLGQRAGQRRPPVL